MRFLTLALGILIGAIFSSALVIAWAGPTSAPPAGNVAAPINVGTTDQIKDAGLGLDALAVFGNSILSGPSVTYLNFGGIAQEAGYGIRDNVGTMEFKNDGGSWSGILTASNIAASIQNYFSSSSSNTVSQIKFADGTTQTSAAGSANSKICATTHTGSWYYAISVPQTWTIATCRQFANEPWPNATYRVGCLFSNSFSWGAYATNAAPPPNPNCGW